jgi:hypothetical protein
MDIKRETHRGQTGSFICPLYSLPKTAAIQQKMSKSSYNGIVRAAILAPTTHTTRGECNQECFLDNCHWRADRYAAAPS